MGKGISDFKLQTRIDEINNIFDLNNEFGNLAFRATERYYENSGYVAGYDRIVKLLKSGEFSKVKFLADPLEGVREFLHGFFVDRGGNLPEVWIENGVVLLKTEITKYCVTIEAEKTAKHCHNDICGIYCRAFAKGMISIFEAFFPGIIINFYNLTTQRDGKGSDCVEAFQILSP